MGRMRIFYELYKNPYDLEHIFSLYQDHTPDKTSIALIRSLLRYPGGKYILRNPPAKLLDMEYLASCNEGTLGHTVYNGSLDSLYSFNKATTPLGLWMVAIHDVLHALTGFSTDPEGEICLQAFSYPHLRVPAPRQLAVAYGVFHPMIIPKLCRSYAWGRQTEWLLPINWDEKLDQPLHIVRQEYALDCNRNPLLSPVGV